MLLLYNMVLSAPYLCVSHAFRKLRCTCLTIAAKQTAANLHGNDSLIVTLEEVKGPKAVRLAGCFSFIRRLIRFLFSFLYYHMDSQRIQITFLYKRDEPLWNPYKTTRGTLATP